MFDLRRFPRLVFSYANIADIASISEIADRARLAGLGAPEVFAPAPALRRTRARSRGGNRARLDLRRRVARRPATWLTVRFDPPAEDLVHHVKLTAKQEVHRSVAATKDVTGLGVDMF